MKNYMVMLDDGPLSWICLTDSEPDGYEVFSTLGVAKEVLLEHLRSIRDQYNNAIYQAKKIKLSDL